MLLAGMIGLLSAGCGGPAPAGDDGADRRPVVITTIYPIADITRNIGGDAFRVMSLIPPGASPHTFEPTPGQMAEIAGAAAFVAVGSGLDDWALALTAAGGSDLIHLRLTDGMELLPGEPGHPGHPGHEDYGRDPHIWLDPVLVRDHIVPAVTGVLIDLAPARKAELTARADAYRQELKALDDEIRQGFAGLDNPRFIAFHPAWRYFAARYGLIQAAAVESAPGKEPSARWIAAVVETARREKVKAVFAEPQFSAKAAEVIAQEFGADVLTVDPLGGEGLEGRDSYLSLMRHNAAVFRDGLE